MLEIKLKENNNMLEEGNISGETLHKIRLETIFEVREVLLRECEKMTWENGHGTDAIPSRTIRKLPELMEYEGREASGIDFILSKFSHEFIKTRYIIDPIANSVVHQMAKGVSIYQIIEMLVNNFNILKKEYEKLILQGPSRSIQL